MSAICYDPCKTPRLPVTGRQVLVLLAATLLVQLGAHLSPTERLDGSATVQFPLSETGTPPDSTPAGPATQQDWPQ